MPVISVIMTSYNHGNFVAEAIESVLAQTFSDFEFIITDDGSPDNTPNIVSDYSKKDERIRPFFFKKNKGACVALEECFKHSQGEYIAIINSDDTWQAEKLEKQFNFLEKNCDIAAVFSRAQAVDERGAMIESDFVSVFNAPENRSRHEWLRHFFFDGNCLCHPSVLIRRSGYVEAGGIYKKYLASLPDLDMWVRLCFKKSIHILDERLVNFRVLNDSRNESADNIANRKRYAIEAPLVLDNYRKIASVDEFRLIFPDWSLFDNPSLIQYNLARCALTISSPWHKLFGMQLLYGLFIIDNGGEVVEGASFDVSDLHKIAKVYDVYNLEFSEKKYNLEFSEKKYKRKYKKMKRFIFFLLTLLLVIFLYNFD